jgi:carboxymethylenebutenolidase
MPAVRDRTVSIPSPRGGLTGYQAEPADGAPHGGVVVIQEWWGIDEHMRDVTRRFAAEGFVALAPDLYRGRVTSDVEEARRLKESLPEADGAADVLAALDHLRAQPQVEPKRLGVVGFCMGGSFALDAAVSARDLAAVVPFYPGRVAEFVDRVEQIDAPVLAIFGAVDPAIPPDVVARFREALERAGKAAEVRVYEGADHAFLNDTSWRHHPEAARDAWARTVAFLRRHVEGRAAG